MINILALYPNEPGSRFDAGYYRTRHVPTASRLLAPYGLIGLRLAEGVAGLDGSPPRFWMVSEMHFRSRDAVDRALAACGEALFADAPNYTDVEPLLQVCAPGETLVADGLMETEHDA